MRLTKEQCKAIVNLAYTKHDIDIDWTVDGVNTAIKMLTPKQREFIQMKFVDKLTYQQIAKKLGVCTDTARRGGI